MMGYRTADELQYEFGGLMCVKKTYDTIIIDDHQQLKDRLTNALGEEFIGGNICLVTTILWPIEVH